MNWEEVQFPPYDEDLPDDQQNASGFSDQQDGNQVNSSQEADESWTSQNEQKSFHQKPRQFWSPPNGRGNSNFYRGRGNWRGQQRGRYRGRNRPFRGRGRGRGHINRPFNRYRHYSGEENEQENRSPNSSLERSLSRSFKCRERSPEERRSRGRSDRSHSKDKSYRYRSRSRSRHRYRSRSRERRHSGSPRHRRQRSHSRDHNRSSSRRDKREYHKPRSDRGPAPNRTAMLREDDDIVRHSGNDKIKVEPLVQMKTEQQQQQMNEKRDLRESIISNNRNEFSSKRNDHRSAHDVKTKYQYFRSMRERRRNNDLDRNEGHELNNNVESDNNVFDTSFKDNMHSTPKVTYIAQGISQICQIKITADGKRSFLDEKGNELENKKVKLGEEDVSHDSNHRYENLDNQNTHFDERVQNCSLNQDTRNRSQDSFHQSSVQFHDQNHNINHTNTASDNTQHRPNVGHNNHSQNVPYFTNISRSKPLLKKLRNHPPLLQKQTHQGNANHHGHHVQGKYTYDYNHGHSSGNYLNHSSASRPSDQSGAEGSHVEVPSKEQIDSAIDWFLKNSPTNSNVEPTRENSEHIQTVDECEVTDNASENQNKTSELNPSLNMDIDKFIKSCAKEGEKLRKHKKVDNNGCVIYTPFNESSFEVKDNKTKSKGKIDSLSEGVVKSAERKSSKDNDSKSKPSVRTVESQPKNDKNSDANEQNLDLSKVINRKSLSEHSVKDITASPVVVLNVDTKLTSTPMAHKSKGSCDSELVISPVPRHKPIDTKTNRNKHSSGSKNKVKCSVTSETLSDCSIENYVSVDSWHEHEQSSKDQSESVLSNDGLHTPDLQGEDQELVDIEKAVVEGKNLFDTFLNKEKTKKRTKSPLRVPDIMKMNSEKKAANARKDKTKEPKKNSSEKEGVKSVEKKCDPQTKTETPVKSKSEKEKSNTPSSKDVQAKSSSKENSKKQKSRKLSSENEKEKTHKYKSANKLEKQGTKIQTDSKIMPKRPSVETQPEAKTSTSLPEAKTSTSVPEAKTSKSVPEAKKSMLVPEAKTSTSLPEAKTSTSVPEAKTSTSLPEAKTSTSLPEAKTSTSLPEAKTSTSVPEAKTSKSVPEAKKSMLVPEAKLMTSVLEAKTSTSQPKDNKDTVDEHALKGTNDDKVENNKIKTKSKVIRNKALKTDTVKSPDGRSMRKASEDSDVSSNDKEESKPSIMTSPVHSLFGRKIRTGLEDFHLVKTPKKEKSTDEQNIDKHGSGKKTKAEISVPEKVIPSMKKKLNLSKDGVKRLDTAKAKVLKMGGHTKHQVENSLSASLKQESKKCNSKEAKKDSKNQAKQKDKASKSKEDQTKRNVKDTSQKKNQNKTEKSIKNSDNKITVDKKETSDNRKPTTISKKNPTKTMLDNQTKKDQQNKNPKHKEKNKTKQEIVKKDQIETRRKSGENEQASEQDNSNRHIDFTSAPSSSGLHSDGECTATADEDTETADEASCNDNATTDCNVRTHDTSNIEMQEELGKSTECDENMDVHLENEEMIVATENCELNDSIECVATIENVDWTRLSEDELQRIENVEQVAINPSVEDSVAVETENETEISESDISRTDVNTQGTTDNDINDSSSLVSAEEIDENELLQDIEANSLEVSGEITVTTTSGSVLETNECSGTYELLDEVHNDEVQNEMESDNVETQIEGDIELNEGETFEEIETSQVVEDFEFITTDEIQESQQEMMQNEIVLEQTVDAQIVDIGKTVSNENGSYLDANISEIHLDKIDTVEVESNRSDITSEKIICQTDCQTVQSETGINNINNSDIASDCIEPNQDCAIDSESQNKQSMANKHQENVQEQQTVQDIQQKATELQATKPSSITGLESEKPIAGENSTSVSSSKTRSPQKKTSNSVNIKKPRWNMSLISKNVSKYVPKHGNDNGKQNINKDSNQSTSAKASVFKNWKANRVTPLKAKPADVSKSVKEKIALLKQITPDKKKETEASKLSQNVDSSTNVENINSDNHQDMDIDNDHDNEIVNEKDSQESNETGFKIVSVCGNVDMNGLENESLPSTDQCFVHSNDRPVTPSLDNLDIIMNSSPMKHLDKTLKKKDNLTSNKKEMITLYNKELEKIPSMTRKCTENVTSALAQSEPNMSTSESELDSSCDKLVIDMEQCHGQSSDDSMIKGESSNQPKDDDNKKHLSQTSVVPKLDGMNNHTTDENMEIAPKDNNFISEGCKNDRMVEKDSDKTQISNTETRQTCENQSKDPDETLIYANSSTEGDSSKETVDYSRALVPQTNVTSESQEIEDFDEYEDDDDDIEVMWYIKGVPQSPWMSDTPQIKQDTADDESEDDFKQPPVLPELDQYFKENPDLFTMTKSTNDTSGNSSIVPNSQPDSPGQLEDTLNDFFFNSMSEETGFKYEATPINETEDQPVEVTIKQEDSEDKSIKRSDEKHDEQNEAIDNSEEISEKTSETVEESATCTSAEKANRFKLDQNSEKLKEFKHQMKVVAIKLNDKNELESTTENNENSTVESPVVDNSDNTEKEVEGGNNSENEKSLTFGKFIGKHIEHCFEKKKDDEKDVSANTQKEPVRPKSAEHGVTKLIDNTTPSQTVRSNSADSVTTAENMYDSVKQHSRRRKVSSPTRVTSTQGNETSRLQLLNPIMGSILFPPSLQQSNRLATQEPQNQPATQPEQQTNPKTIMREQMDKLMQCMESFAQKLTNNGTYDFSRFNSIHFSHVKVMVSGPDRNTIGEFIPTLLVDRLLRCVNCSGCKQSFSPYCFMRHVCGMPWKAVSDQSFRNEPLPTATLEGASVVIWKLMMYVLTMEKYLRSRLVLAPKLTDNDVSAWQTDKRLNVNTVHQHWNQILRQRNQNSTQSNQLQPATQNIQSQQATQIIQSQQTAHNIQSQQAAQNIQSQLPTQNIQSQGAQHVQSQQGVQRFSAQNQMGAMAQGQIRNQFYGNQVPPAAHQNVTNIYQGSYRQPPQYNPPNNAQHQNPYMQFNINKSSASNQQNMASYNTVQQYHQTTMTVNGNQTYPRYQSAPQMYNQSSSVVSAGTSVNQMNCYQTQNSQQQAAGNQFATSFMYQQLAGRLAAAGTCQATNVTQHISGQVTNTGQNSRNNDQLNTDVRHLPHQSHHTQLQRLVLGGPSKEGSNQGQTREAMTSSLQTYTSLPVTQPSQSDFPAGRRKSDVTYNAPLEGLSLLTQNNPPQNVTVSSLSNLAPSHTSEPNVETHSRSVQNTPTERETHVTEPSTSGILSGKSKDSDACRDETKQTLSEHLVKKLSRSVQNTPSHKMVATDQHSKSAENTPSDRSTPLSKRSTSTKDQQSLSDTIPERTASNVQHCETERRLSDSEKHDNIQNTLNEKPSLERDQTLAKENERTPSCSTEKKRRIDSSSDEGSSKRRKLSESKHSSVRRRLTSGEVEGQCDEDINRNMEPFKITTDAGIQTETTESPQPSLDLLQMGSPGDVLKAFQFAQEIQLKALRSMSQIMNLEKERFEKLQKEMEEEKEQRASAEKRLEQYEKKFETMQQLMHKD